MTQWQQTAAGISYTFGNQVVHVKNDPSLIEFLAQDGLRSLQLADELLIAYKNTFQESLNISKDSLAIELIGHVRVDEVLASLTKLTEKLPIETADAFVHQLKNRTEIIDCGEKSLDTNRFVWDLLVPFKELIFKFAE